MMKRVFWPSNLKVSTLRAFAYGVLDGWKQPHEVSSSRNVEHLDNGSGTVYDDQDRGINLGQMLRSPINYERIN